MDNKQSIDTPEIHELLGWVMKQVGEPQGSSHRRDFISHIDAQFAPLHARIAQLEESVKLHLAHAEFLAAKLDEARQGGGEPVYQVMEGEFGEYWQDAEKATYDEANEQGINTRVVYLAPPAQPAPTQGAQGDDPIGDLQAAARQAKLEDAVRGWAAGAAQQEAVRAAPDGAKEDA